MKRLPANLAAVLLVTACSHAAVRPTPKPEAPSKAAAKPTAQATVPMALETNRPYIDVTLTGPDGRMATAHAWVDTGGGGIIIAAPLERAPKGGWEITSVHGNAARFAAGDRLVRVGTLEADGATLSQLVGALSGKAGDTRTVTVQRDGKTLTVEAPVVQIL